MTLSSQMRQELLTRLAAAETKVGTIQLVGPELHCETVEDAEKLVDRFSTWQLIFADLRKAAELPEDREGLARLHATFEPLVIDLRNAIHRTRDHGVPWEQTRTIADPRIGIINASNAIAGSLPLPTSWNRGDRVRVRRGEHEGRTGTVSLLPFSSYAPYVTIGEHQVQVALDGEPGDTAVGPGARAAGGRGGISIVIDNNALEPYEGPPGRALGRQGDRS